MNGEWFKAIGVPRETPVGYEFGVEWSYPGEKMELEYHVRGGTHGGLRGSYYLEDGSVGGRHVVNAEGDFQIRLVLSQKESSEKLTKEFVVRFGELVEGVPIIL